MKTFRIWHSTQFGVGFEDKKAKSKDSLKIPKRIKNVIEVEVLN